MERPNVAHPIVLLKETLIVIKHMGKVLMIEIEITF